MQLKLGLEVMPMVAKEYLKKIARMESYIQSKKERLAVLKEMSSGISPPILALTASIRLDCVFSLNRNALITSSSIVSFAIM